ncbi:MAG: hypothetical protein ACR2JB_04205 [Bryobacteraceae bacterium]
MDASREMTGFLSEIRSQWKKIGLVGTVGIFLGFATAAASNCELMRVTLKHRSQGSSTASTGDIDEILQLKTRNRRLQALVDVLQERVRQQNNGAGQ